MQPKKNVIRAQPTKRCISSPPQIYKKKAHVCINTKQFAHAAWKTNIETKISVATPIIRFDGVIDKLCHLWANDRHILQTIAVITRFTIELRFQFTNYYTATRWCQFPIGHQSKEVFYH